MRKIYLASSWRNDYQPQILEFLRASGYDVYDFKDADGFKWSEIDPDWEKWATERYVNALQHPLANKGFARDMDALRDCDILVLLLPCGRSAHLEAGWAVGAGKLVFVFSPVICEPELMYKMCEGVYGDPAGLLKAISDTEDVT